MRLRVIKHADKANLLPHVVREVHVNTVEGLWTTLRTFLRPFRGVYKKYLAGYGAMCEFGVSLRRITPAFIASLVAVHFGST